MADDLKFLANGRRPNFFVNGRRLQIFYTGNTKTETISTSGTQLELSLAQLSPSLFYLLPDSGDEYPVPPPPPALITARAQCCSSPDSFFLYSSFVFSDIYICHITESVVPGVPC